MIEYLVPFAGSLAALGAAHAAKLSNFKSATTNGGSGSDLFPIGDKNFWALQLAKIFSALIDQYSIGDWKPSTTSSTLWYVRFSNRYNAWPQCRQQTLQGDWAAFGIERGTWNGVKQFLRANITKYYPEYYGRFTVTEMDNIITNLVTQAGYWDKFGGGVKEQTCLESWVNGWGGIASTLGNFIVANVSKVFAMLKKKQADGSIVDGVAGNNGDDTMADAQTISQIALLFA